MDSVPLVTNGGYFLPLSPFSKMCRQESERRCSRGLQEHIGLRDG
jgi:hypothetical protein